MNSVVLIGRLARDPELGYTTTQTAVCKFTLAVKKTESEADFIPCKCFSAQAENLNRWKKKGDYVAVQGRISTGSYTNKQGVKVNYTEVLADRVEFLGKSEPKETPRNPENTFSATDDYVPF